MNKLRIYGGPFLIVRCYSSGTRISVQNSTWSLLGILAIWKCIHLRRIKRATRKSWPSPTIKIGLAQKMVGIRMLLGGWNHPLDQFYAVWKARLLVATRCFPICMPHTKIFPRWCERKLKGNSRSMTLKAFGSACALKAHQKSKWRNLMRPTRTRNIP